MDRGEVTCILLDLFAAFDTVDHLSFSIVFTRGSVLMAFHLISPHLISHLVLAQTVSINDSIYAFSTLSCGVPPKFRSWPTAFTLDTVLLGSMISRNSLIYTVSFVCWWYPAVHLFHFNEFCSIYLLKHLPPLSLSFSPGWTWTNCSSLHQKPHSLLLAENNNVSNFLTSKTRISSMISSQSVSLLAILIPPVSVTCISLIKSTLCWNSSNSSSFPSCSDSSCEFTCPQQQTWLLQLTILCYLTS